MLEEEKQANNITLKPAIDIDINSIFYQLHLVALENAKKNNKQIDIINLGVNDKQESFVGAGEFAIVAQLAKDIQQPTEQNKQDEFKKECINALKAYIELFVGSDIVKIIDKDPDCIKRLDKPVNTENKIITTNKLSDFLIESPQDTNSTEYNKKNRVGIGYYIEYSLDIEGQKKHQFIDMAKKVGGEIGNALMTVAKVTGKSLFGDIISDLKDFKFKLNGIEIKAGEKIAKGLSAVASGAKNLIKIGPDTYKRMFGQAELEKIENILEQQIRKIFPTSRATFRTYKIDTLVNMLLKAKKLNSELKQKLMSNMIMFRMEYCITAEVGDEDQNYEQYSTKFFAKIFQDALNQEKVRLSFSEKNILKISNFDSKYGLVKLKQPSASIESYQNTKNDLITLLFEYGLNSKNDNIQQSKIEDKKQDKKEDKSIKTASINHKIDNNKDINENNDLYIFLLKNVVRVKDKKEDKTESRKRETNGI